MEKIVKESTRIQSSILNAAEKKILIWLAQRQPKWVTSDHLTYFGTFGAIVIALGYFLSNYSIYFLWISSLGFVLNWYGDSLDGTLARVRKRQRPVYGYYLDHTVDAINEVIMFIGAGLSPFIDMKIAMLALIAYLLITVNVSMNSYLKNEFKLTYLGMGPTELRIIMILFNTILILIGPKVLETNIINYGTIGITAILFFVYLLSIIQDLKYYSIVDPMPDDKKNDAD